MSHNRKSVDESFLLGSCCQQITRTDVVVCSSIAHYLSLDRTPLAFTAHPERLEPSDGALPSARRKGSPQLPNIISSASERHLRDIWLGLTTNRLGHSELQQRAKGENGAQHIADNEYTVAQPARRVYSSQEAGRRQKEGYSQHEVCSLWQCRISSSKYKMSLHFFTVYWFYHSDGGSSSYCEPPLRITEQGRLCTVCRALVSCSDPAGDFRFRSPCTLLGLCLRKEDRGRWGRL